MRFSGGLFVAVFLSLAFEGDRAFSVEAARIVEGLRSQMQALQSIRAEATIETRDVRTGQVDRSDVLYVRSGEKFNSIGTMTQGDHVGREVRLVYDGFLLRRFTRDRQSEAAGSGAVWPLDPDPRQLYSDPYDILKRTGYGMSLPAFDAMFARLAYGDLGRETIAGFECVRIAYRAGVSNGQRAYMHLWIQVDGSKYTLRKAMFLVGSDPARAAWEADYIYEPSAEYAFPATIHYRQYGYDRQDVLSLEFEEVTTIKAVQINVQPAAEEFSFVFPEGVEIDVAADPPDGFEGGCGDRPAGLDWYTALWEGMPPEAEAHGTFGFTQGENLLFAPLRIGPTRYPFLLDTGASITFFNICLKQYLGAPTQQVSAQGIGQTLMLVPFFDAPTARVGPFDLAAGDEVAVANLKLLGLMFGRNIGGILGVDFLKHHVIQVDFDEGRVTFVQERPQNEPDWGTEFALSYDPGGLPQIIGKLPDGGEREFVIDTGYQATGSLDKHVFDALVAQRDLPTRESTFAGLTGIERTVQTRLDRLSVGPFEYRGLILSRAVGNILGLDFLSRHRVTFDFPNNKLYLKKGRQFDKVDEADMSGLRLLRYADSTVVYSSGHEHGRPAARAGLEAGDVILEINGTDARAYEMWQIHELLRSGDGKKITMTVQRGTARMEVSFRLEKEV